ncbi:MAG: hypothetical protein HKN57_14785 [Xanthomonadales bacterium]|nr:hypothetical protein [Gammaproteobacteria bacterium]MBT8054830.1 hypothetical protein [Gammaproteobacteria bacterium]NND58511.1 hypothetical protein [Xanthomonadales bacterium]NNK51095.1 hypothetical protein [Xanthomonadales bacterium]
MTASATAKDYLDSPDYLAYKFNFSTENIEFLPVRKSEIRRANSLSREFIGSDRPLIPVPLAELAPLLDPSSRQLQDNPPRFVFHTAFCSSTFISRCLDVDGISIGLREPQLLLDAANAKRLQWRSQTTPLDHRDWPRLALQLLGKHAGPAGKLVIKPINSVNNIISELLQITGTGRSLMLYTDARNFLLSTLKKGEEAKFTVRAMFDLTRCDFPHLANLRLSDTIHMTDIKVILTLWRLQIEQAEQALQQFSAANRMASVYGERLIDDPRNTLQSANRFLQLGIQASQIDDIATGDHRFSDAKNTGQAFSTATREKAYVRVEKYYGTELDNALNWLFQNNPGTRLEPRLSGALPAENGPE